MPRRAAPLAALLAAAALCTLGGLHALGHADAIVPVLVSLRRFTPFYWEQERYGMLVPLLARPVSDPLANLLLQRFLTALAGLGAVALVARHALGGREARLAGVFAAGLLLAAAPGPWLFEYLVDQPYGLSLALALGGLAIAAPEQGRPGPLRLAAGAALVLAAHWVNAAAGLVLLPLAVARGLVAGREGLRRLATEAALLSGGLASGVLVLRLAPALAGGALQTSLGFLPPAAWPGAWAALVREAWLAGSAWAAALAACAAAGLALLAADPARRPELPRTLLRAGALVAAAAAYAAFCGTLRWVAQNGHHWRYLAPSAVLVHVAAVALLAAPLLGALLAFGWPSLARVRADLERTTGRFTPALLAAGCDVVAGDYWSVWPAVWHVAWTRHARGEPGTLHGLSHRAAPTLSAWRGRAGVRVCVPGGQEAIAARWIARYGLAGEVSPVVLPAGGLPSTPWPDSNRSAGVK